MSVGSLQARPKNESPTGNPEMNPMGTVMWGYPATAGGVESPPRSWSPSMWSVSHARRARGSHQRVELVLIHDRVDALRTHELFAFLQRVQIFLLRQIAFPLRLQK